MESRIIRIDPLKPSTWPTGTKVQHIDDWNRWGIVDGCLVPRIAGGLPIETSFMKGEPSMGPAAASTVSDVGIETLAETNTGLEVKVIPGELITMPLFASTVSQTIFLADGNTYQVTYVAAIPDVLGGAGATVNVEVLTGTTANGSGTAQLSAAIALSANAHTALQGTLIAAPTRFNNSNSGRLGIVMAGTLTGLVGLLTVAVKKV